MILSLAWIGPAFLAGLSGVVQGRLWGEPASFRPALFWSLDWLMFALLTPGVFVLARWWPITRPHTRRSVLLHVVAAIVFSAVWAGGGTILKVLIQPETLKQGVAKFAIVWFFGTLPFGSVVYFSTVGIENAIRYLVEARESELQLSRLSEQLTGARLAALQARLKPHFLFNSLNTIAVLVRGGKKTTATHVIEQLSDVLRLTLNRTEAHEVRLDQELNLVRRYLAVEQARFSDRLAPEYSIDPATFGAAVPSFALQHLVENALRHGIATLTAAGRLTISSRRDGDILELVVIDDGGGIAPQASERPGHGLANTRDRLRNLYGDSASLEVAAAGIRGTTARLRLPFHELPAQREADASA